VGGGGGGVFRPREAIAGDVRKDGLRGRETLQLSSCRGQTRNFTESEVTPEGRCDRPLAKTKEKTCTKQKLRRKRKGQLVKRDVPDLPQKQLRDEKKRE